MFVCLSVNVHILICTCFDIYFVFLEGQQSKMICKAPLYFIHTIANLIILGFVCSARRTSPAERCKGTKEMDPEES